MSQPTSSSSSSDPWTVNYVNDEHIQAFTRALDFNDASPHEFGDSSPHSPRSPPAPLSPVEGDRNKLQIPETWKYGPDNGALGISGREREGGVERVEKLTATSDFAPIHQRVSRRKTVTSQGWTYHLIRWPLLAILFTIISFEFNAYVITRQIVNVFEYIVAWRGKKGTFRQDLRQAKTYEEWKAAARRMDKMLGFDDWKDTEDDGYYDYFLVKRVRRTLTKLRAANDTRGLMDALAVCVRPNFAGTEGVKMYSETFFGTKKLVEAHIDEVVASIDYVRTATNVSLEEKRVFFRGINKNYGSSALCLSGGASFGYYHFGVIKAFLEADLLPRVVTGTSAGGLVAALLCTRTNDELKEILIPQLADKITACEDSMPVWVRRWWKTGARFSAVDWVSKAMFFTMGSLTFKEAYERTGRALNVTVVPSDRHSPTILLNHLTAPNCIIWSAIIASAAVPGILNPVVLMAKDRNGQVKPHNLGGSRFKDGSLREDIPLGSLHTQFNCNFSIVSQTNPHIHLFFFAPRGSVGRPVAHRKGKGWRGGFILSALESYIKLDLNKHFKVIRDLDLLPQILQSDWSGVFLQRFSGDLTLTPRSTAGDWFRLLSDPDRTQLQRMLEVGERVSWPSLHMVRNRMAIERAVFRGRSEIRQATNRERTTNDAALTAFKEHEYESAANNRSNQVPIESDADAGFASRTRRIKAHRSLPPAAEAFGNPPAEGSTGARNSNNMSLRRRKVFPRATPTFQVAGGSGGQGHRRRPSEVVFDPPGDDGEEGDEEDDDQTRTVRGGSSSSAPATAAPSPAAKGTYAALGDTFRNVRATSLSAFSPFRSRLMSSNGTRPTPNADGPATTDGEIHASGSSGSGSGQGLGISTGAGLPAQKRRSQSSISRWFGGGGDSSESDDDTVGGSGGGGLMGRVDEGQEGSARSRSPDDFVGGGALGMAFEDEDDEDGAVIVSDTDVDLIEREDYSPPQQDTEGHL